MTGEGALVQLRTPRRTWADDLHEDRARGPLAGGAGPSDDSAPAPRTLVWFRGKDLRVEDHEALSDAATGEVACVFVLEPKYFGRARALPHRMQFLLDSVAALGSALAERGGRLVLLEGPATVAIPRAVDAWGITRVVALRRTEPGGRRSDREVSEALGVPLELKEGETLAAPGEVLGKSGAPLSVFTPFARAHRAQVRVGRPLPAPASIRWASGFGSGVRLPSLADLGIARNDALPRGGEEHGKRRLRAFLAARATRYPQERDRLDLDATSRLSADLKFGTLSARTVWRAAREALEASHPEAWAKFSDELLWREFTHAVLWEHPSLLYGPRRREFEAFPWRDDEAGWAAWVEGRTGYPVVDASARQLLREGFVHNRARMISASFLAKDLLIDYRRGEAHYMRQLTDGDWAQNDAGWQWTAGCGYDAAPYFRVFNPVEQGKRFDPSGGYVRRWVPELARLPDAHLHAPWQAPASVLREAGVELGRTYPAPIVDHAAARLRFLAAAQAALAG